MLTADVRRGIIKNTYHPRYLIRDNPLVSVIVAGNSGSSDVRACLEAFYENGNYANCEVIVVGEEFSDLLWRRPVRFLDCAASQSQESAFNKAVGQANGQYTFFLDGCARLLTPQSLPYMLCNAQRKEVGIVGPKILYRTEAIYSAGIVMGRSEGLFAHTFQGRTDIGDRYAANTIRNYLAVSNLCFLVAKNKFQGAGGYDEQFGSTVLSQLDLCLKLHESGHRNLYTPFVTVYNQVPVEKPLDGNGAQRFRAKWHKYLDYDPYYSPNLSRKRADFSI